jgi:hypothetical protein
MGHRPVRAAFILMWSLHLRQRMFRRLSAELVQPSQLPSAHGPQARACWLERRYCILLRVCVFHQFHVYFESLSARGNLPRAVIFGNFLCTLHGAAAFVGCRVLSRAAGGAEANWPAAQAAHRHCLSRPSRGVGQPAPGRERKDSRSRLAIRILFCEIWQSSQWVREL